MKGNEQSRWLKAFLAGMAVTAMLAGIAVALMPRRHAPVVEVPHWLRRLPAPQSADGPWGQLEAVAMPFVNPGNETPESERLKAPKWFFERFSEPQLKQFLASCHLTGAQHRALFDKHRWTATANGCVIAPPPHVVLSLSREVRARLYSTLAQSPINYPQHFVFRFPSNFLERGVAAFGGSPHAVATVRSLTYMEDEEECFADLHAAKQVLDARDFQLLVEMLRERPAYLLRLRVSSSSDIDGLVNYWGVNGRTNLIRPLLTAISRIPGGASLSVSQLLPPFPRLRLYTFPTEWSDTQAAPKECFFTALNFFNATLDTNAYTPEYIRGLLNNSFSTVHGQPLYGDVVLLTADDDTIIHAAVYIAGNYVFTKNGLGTMQPWVMMNQTDMQRLYPEANPARTMIVRRQGSRPCEATARAGTAMKSGL